MDQAASPTAHAAATAVREALGGHGRARSARQHATPVVVASSATRVSVPAPVPVPGHYSAGIAKGPAPFVSPSRQQPAASRSAQKSPSPRHTAVTIHDDHGAARPAVAPVPSSSTAAVTNRPNVATPPLRFRAPPLSVDTSPGPHRKNHPNCLPPAAGSEAASPSAPIGRRRTPSSHAGGTSGSAPGPLRQHGALSRPAHGTHGLVPPLPPVATALLSSVFVRRKPLQRRPPSPANESAGHGLGLGLASHTAPQVFFFQDADSDTASHVPRDRHDTAAVAGGDTATISSDGSQHSTADDSHNPDHDDLTTDHADTVEPTRKAVAKSPRKRASSQFPLPQLVGLEKLGELSREEEAYDFAILLKPTKVEEHLEMVHVGATTAHGDDPLDGSLAVSAIHGTATGNNATGTGNAEIDDTFAKLPGTPRAHVRRQRQDPVSARAQLLERITRTGLHVKRLLSLDGKQTLLKVRAPPRVLELGAERLRLRKRRQFDQIWMEFSSELRATFADFDPATDRVAFLDSEKQSIVHALLTGDARDGSGAGLDEFCPLKAKLVLKMFPLHKHDDLVALRTQWVTYWREDDNDGKVEANDSGSGSGCATAVTRCGRRVQRLATHALWQPVDAIAQYYGERIAFYFAWLEMYTRWLIVPSVAGVVLFILQVQAKTLDHPLASCYAIFMALWTSAFLLAWKRRAAALAYKWGTLGYEQDERVRPEFRGDAAYSTATHKVYPAWKRYATYAVTVPLVVASIALVLLLTFYAFVTRDRLEAESIAIKAQATDLAKDIARDLQRGLTLANLQRLRALGMDWDFWFYFLLTPMLYGLLIPVLDYAFTRVARRLTAWENHATESRHESHLILKVFSFRFVHVFASLYYYAFNAPDGGSSLLRVAVQLASFMISDQLWRNAMQTLYPFVKRRLQVRRKKQATNAQFHASTVFNTLGHGSGTGHGTGHGSRRGTRHGSQLVGRTASHHAPLTSNAVIHEQCVRLEQASDHAWEEAELEPYDTFEDYTEMLIQFGYVAFFSLAFPLAPLLALVNNLLEIRMDAFKLCHAKQRPRAQKASGIGVWHHVLQLLSVLAVLTNCLHIAFTTTLVERVFPGVTSTHKVWVVFGVEHAILALKVWMMVVVPATPGDVQRHVRKEREHAKLESARALAAKLTRQQQPGTDDTRATGEADAVPPQHSGGDDNDQDADATGVRRRHSRGSSSAAAMAGTSHDSDDNGLRAAQAVLAEA